ncbi:hypothetical protein, partial [Streptomyces rochei]
PHWGGDRPPAPRTPASVRASGAFHGPHRVNPSPVGPSLADRALAGRSPEPRRRLRAPSHPAPRASERGIM